jgi:hypothetical protein
LRPGGEKEKIEFVNLGILQSQEHEDEEDEEDEDEDNEDFFSFLSKILISF